MSFYKTAITGIIAASVLCTATAFAATNYTGRKDLNGKSFANQNLSGASFRGAAGSGVDFSGAALTGATFYGATFTKSSFAGARLSTANFRGATVTYNNFDKANLQRAIFYGANLAHSTFIGADLRGANLEGADMRHANLCEAKMDAKTNIKGTDFRAAQCSQQVLAQRTARGGGGSKGSISYQDFKAQAGKTVMTKFDPKVHGFRFVNDFNNDFIREINLRTSGLCGGMVYTAMDYYLNRMPIPLQTYRPAVQTRLHDYIYRRQVTSLKVDIAKWGELKADFTFGARNSEFFRWGLQGFNGGRLQELRAKLDRGIPAPISLAAYGGTGPSDHQVLAIGYNLGRYKGDLKQYMGDVRIFIYDPNHPYDPAHGVSGTVTLVPDMSTEKFYYKEYPKEFWRTYFVSHYQQKKPIPADNRKWPNDNLVHELVVNFVTGNDDLGAGSSFDLEIYIEQRPRAVFLNVNHKRRWLNGYNQTVSFKLPDAIRKEDIRYIRIQGHMAGGDNWTLQKLYMDGIVNNAPVRILTREDSSGRPAHVFSPRESLYSAGIR